MARITSNAVLMERVIKMLPKGIPAEAIDSVECDATDGDGPDGASYWVNLNEGWKCLETDCHVIHEDTLADIRRCVRQIAPWPDDPDLVLLQSYQKTIPWTQRDERGLVATGEMFLRDAQQWIQKFEQEARKRMETNGADHMVYAVKNLGKAGEVTGIDFYLKPLTEDEFEKRVAPLTGVQVYAIHRMK